MVCGIKHIKGNLSQGAEPKVPHLDGEFGDTEYVPKGDSLSITCPSSSSQDAVLCDGSC